MTIWRFLRYLHDGYQKLPRSVTAQDRVRRVTSSQEFLDLFTSDQDKFVGHIVTGDETWIHRWYTQSKQESMRWRHASSNPPRKFRTQPPAGKIMATIFWDNKDVLLIDYLPDKSTMKRQYYANLLLKLLQAIKDKLRGMLTRRVWLVHDSCPVHSLHCPASCLRLSLCTARSPCTQSWPSSQWLLFVLKSEVSSSWCPLFRHRFSEGYTGSMVGRIYRRIIFSGHKQFGRESALNFVVSLLKN